MPEYYYTASPTSGHEDRHFNHVFAGKVLRFSQAGVTPAHARQGAALLSGGGPFPPAPGEALRFFPGGATPACA